MMGVKDFLYSSVNVRVFWSLALDFRICPELSESGLLFTILCVVLPVITPHRHYCFHFWTCRQWERNTQVSSQTYMLRLGPRPCPDGA